jgi:hypothetical protein
MLSGRLEDAEITAEHARKRMDRLGDQIGDGDRDGALESLEWLANYAAGFRDRADVLADAARDVYEIYERRGEDE